jgi:hypothetical protein
MRQIPSLLRVAATRRRLPGVGNGADDASAGHSLDTLESRETCTLPTMHAAWDVRRLAYRSEALTARLATVTYAMAQMSPMSPMSPMSQGPQPLAPIPPRAPTARASADFTAQVMARLATPPTEPDPREVRARQVRAHVRRLAWVYLALVVVSGVALLALATLAPWMLLALIAAFISLALIAMTFATFISRLTGGAISGFGVAYLAMLATLTAPLLLLARRTGRRPFSHARRR